MASVPPELADRDAFVERLRVQIESRYRDLDVTADAERFGVHVEGTGIDSWISVAPLWTACVREPARTSTLIADFVRQAEASLAPVPPEPVHLGRVLWCVRTEGYLRGHTRCDDLLTRPLAGSLVAFVAETLPNSIMQGVPREAWSAAGEDATAAAADRNTAVRFEAYAGRIRAREHVARDGWSFSGDVLFMGSVLLVPDVLAALVERAGGDVLVANPGRELVRAIPAASEGARDFRRHVTRAFREGLHPVSREVLRTDGTGLRLEEPEPRRRGRLAE